MKNEQAQMSELLYLMDMYENSKRKDPEKEEEYEFEISKLQKQLMKLSKQIKK